METIFKLLVARLVAKASELFSQVNEKPMLSDNFLLSVVFINFEKLKPKNKLDKKIYIQILLLYAMGWLEEYLDEIKDENKKNQTLFFLLCQFYKYLIGSSILISNDSEFSLLQQEIFHLIDDERLTKKLQIAITQLGRSNAAYDKDEGAIDTSLALILNVWMQFKGLK
jgi:hypothetical protein